MKNMVDKIRFSTSRPWFIASGVQLILSAIQVARMALGHP